MDWLNYHHLLYFWTVVREGTVVRAAEKLRIGQPAISTQLRTLEESLGQKLFEKSGRTLQLTDTGRTVYRYADEIFSLGSEMMDTLKGHPAGKPVRFVVGVVNALPKLIALRLLEPALRISGDLRLVCVEDTLENLLSALAVHSVDIVLSDCPTPSSMRIRAYNHFLSESKVGLFAVREMARKCRKEFPASLNGVPVLLPGAQSDLRRSMDQWFQKHQIFPMIRGEFDDSALLKAFGRSGEGVFPGPVSIRDEICRQYECEFIGEMAGVTERFYAVSAERKIKHPAVLAIAEFAAGDKLPR
jgi:LysR family transcriptional activator of nhaA